MIGGRVRRLEDGVEFEVAAVEYDGRVALRPVEFAEMRLVSIDVLQRDFDGDTDDPNLRPGEAEANRAEWAREFEERSLREGIANAAYNARLVGEHQILPESP